MTTVPSPPTFTDGVMITAANLNAALKDPCNFMVNTRPHAFARQLDPITGPNAMVNTTWTTVTWDYADVDTDTTPGFVFTGGPPTRSSYYTVNTAGYYLITGHLNYFGDAGSVGSRMARLAFSVGAGAIGIIPGAVEAVPATIVATGVCVSAIRNCAVGDRLYLQGYHDQGVNINTNNNYNFFRNETSYLDVIWVGK
jgi:hypothetical protein